MGLLRSARNDGSRGVFEITTRTAFSYQLFLIKIQRGEQNPCSPLCILIKSFSLWTHEFDGCRIHLKRPFIGVVDAAIAA